MWNFGLIFLLFASNIDAYSYVPPTVEIPPVDENQIRSNAHMQRDDSGNRRGQYSYSHGTTSNQQSPGYASARLINQPSAPTLTPPTQQRPECQHPQLRVFFKACYPPGMAPQSPVQCTPIPGQSTFRCTIQKAASWPATRITNCAPGYMTSDCTNAPPGSFSTGGVVVVPISYATGSPGVRTQTSSVYRHCSNGACQTCIGDQCSTTGAQIPISVDHRGRANSSTEVVAFGDAGRDVKQKCAGRECRTCIDRVCFDRTYPLLRVTAGCPPAVCEENCDGFVYWTDQCPICKCRGFASREPCRSQTECRSSSGTCRNQVCIYADLGNVHYDKVCTFSSQCAADQLCYNWKCGAKPAKSRHLVDHSCAVDQDCPGGYICADMSCWEGDASRLIGQPCLLNHQCPTGYFCTNGACTNSYHHGSFGSFAPSSPTVPPTTDRQCTHDRQCYGGESCWEQRCVTYDERRRMEDDRQRQQSQIDPWRQRQTTTVAPEQVTNGRQSSDDEYQRRLDEYNRRRQEQERQYEEERRQQEEERRRRDQEETERRHREQLESDRRRQEEEFEQRRRQSELDEQRRRQEAENERLQREREESQRRIEQETRQRQQEMEERRIRESQSTRPSIDHDQESRRRQEEENRRRLEEQESRRRQDDENRRRLEESQRRQDEIRRQEEARNRHQPAPTPDIEVGEEMPENVYDDDQAIYERGLQEYQRQLAERQRQLESDDHEDQRTTASTNDQRDQADDFYGRTRQRSNSQTNQRRH